MYNKIYQLEVYVYLNNNIHIKNSYEKIANLINFSMNKNQELSKLHLQHRGFKHYCISGLTPSEKDMILKEGEIYSFRIRSLKQEIINNFKSTLQGIETEDFIVVNINDIIKFEADNVNEIYSVTPTIVTKNDKCWNYIEDEFEYFKQSIFNNLNKKYNDLQKINLSVNIDDIIDDISIKNKYAVVTEYKNVKFLGYKVRIKFKDNNLAKDFIRVALAEGIGERNSSFCQGFCNGRKI